MKIFSSLAIAIFLMFAVVASSAATVPPQNIVAGVFDVSARNNWAGLSALNLIAGTSIMPVAGTQTVLYIAFTAGSTADIGNMVLYATTARSGFTVASTTKVTLGGVSNPTINLTNTSVCPTQPVSTAHPCVVRLDAINLVLSPLVDYYFVAYFLNDSNNQAVSAAVPAVRTSTLTGGLDNADDTQLTAGQTLPTTTNSGKPYFLVAVMNQ
jgi:hypothetical protein